jgi:hypothetical protein
MKANERNHQKPIASATAARRSFMLFFVVLSAEMQGPLKIAYWSQAKWPSSRTEGVLFCCSRFFRAYRRRWRDNNAVTTLIGTRIKVMSPQVRSFLAFILGRKTTFLENMAHQVKSEGILGHVFGDRVPQCRPNNVTPTHKSERGGASGIHSSVVVRARLKCKASPKIDRQWPPEYGDGCHPRQGIRR